MLHLGFDEGERLGKNHEFSSAGSRQPRTTEPPHPYWITSLSRLIAAVLVFLALSNVGDDDGRCRSSFAGTVNVVTLSRAVSAGTTLSDDDLQSTTLPENGLADGALTTTDGLTGLVVRQNLARGEQLTTQRSDLNSMTPKSS